MSTAITGDKVPPELSDLAFKIWRQGMYRSKQVSPMKWAYEWINPHTQQTGFGYTREKHGFKAFGFCNENLMQY